MFDALFNYPKVRARHQAGPAADERQRYLVHRATVDGVAHATLLRIARELLIVARWIDLAPGRPVTLGAALEHHISSGATLRIRFLTVELGSRWRTYGRS